MVELLLTNNTYHIGHDVKRNDQIDQEEYEGHRALVVHCHHYIWIAGDKEEEHEGETKYKQLGGQIQVRFIRGLNQKIRG